MVVKLIDFGTAVALEERGAKVSSGGRIGTWSYWAPEQLNQQPYDFAVDMWSLGILLYILLVGFHPFDPSGDGTEQQILANMKDGKILFDDEEWDKVSPKAKSLVTALLQRDPAKRLTAPELISHPWVRGEDVAVTPLPATHERLSAFIKARHAFYGSLLMGILAHHLTAAAGAEGLSSPPSDVKAEFNPFEVGWKLFDRDNKGHIDASDLRRVCLEMGYKVSQRDVENMIAVMSPTQIIGDGPLDGSGPLGGRAGDGGSSTSGQQAGEAGEADGATGVPSGGAKHAKISFERYKTTMQASFMRRFATGAYVFQRGDPVDHFYVITRGHCDVIVPRRVEESPAAAGGKVPSGGGGGGGGGGGRDDANSTLRSSPTINSSPSSHTIIFHPEESVSAVGGSAGVSSRGGGGGGGSSVSQAAPVPEGEVVIATLGPGDFFGETGLLEGRQMRAASVLCRSDVEVMAMDKEIFKQVAGQSGKDGEQNKLASSMRQKADARQRARLTKVFEMMNVAAQQRRSYPKGSVVFRQGAAADHFYIVNRGELEMAVQCADGRAVRVKRLGPGDHFGYDALLADAHDSTVSCLTDVELTAVPQDELRLASTRDGYLGETMMAQGHKDSERARSSVESQEEAQILPMMAKAAAEGQGVEYDKYEQMLAQMASVSYASGQAVFRQGDPADKVYLVAAGELDVGTEASSSLAPPAAKAPPKAATGSAADGGKVRRTPSSSGFRVVARLGPGDHFGETALLEGRNQRNTTVRCTSPVCELREMPNEEFKKFLRESSQLSASVHAAAVSRNNRRVRKVIRAAEEEGKATMLKLKPGQVIFHQGDRSDAFYVVESGEVQMSLMPASDMQDGDESHDDSPEPIPVRRYQPGDCFGASGILPGDNFRRNTATAIGEVTLKAIPHSHFRVMLRDDKFLKAGLQANDVLYHKWKEANAHPEANASELVTGEIADELLDEVVQKAQRR